MIDFKSIKLSRPKSIRDAFHAMFSIIWCCWLLFAISFFGLCSLIAFLFIFNFQSKKKARITAFKVTKWWGSSFAFFSFIKMKISGLENIDCSENYVIASNHLSVLDIVVAMSASPIPFSFLAKSEVNKIPIVGYLARNMHLLVDRGSKASRMRSIQHMKEEVISGRSVHIFVEGTRNKSDQPLLRFHDGAFRLAIETGKPMLVMAIIRSNEIIYSFGKAQPGEIEVKYFPPIKTEDLELEDLDMLKMRVRNMLTGALT